LVGKKKAMIQLIHVEIVGLIGATVFGVIWALDPTGNWEPLTALCGLIEVGTEFASFA